ncbi:phage distal tail protein [Streptomyces griseus]|uniref:phage distal tail protein n=1 Tax=Streptomyces griseus TaxID=1911 RepID=UPI0033B1D303
MYTPGQDLGGLRADLGDLPLGGVDGFGVAWYLQKLEGWDSSDSRSEVQRREGDHGAWFTPVYLAERPITLEGVIVAPDRTVLEEAMERARGAAALTDTVLVVQESVWKRAVVRRSGRPIIQYLTDTTASYSLLVTAADPRRYEADVHAETTGLPMSTGGISPPLTPPILLNATTVSGQITAVNTGTFATSPVLRIDGPVIAPSVYAQYQDSSVRLLDYTETINAGEYLVIDVDSKQAILNGTASRRRFLSAQWPVIPAGEVVTFQFSADSYDPAALLTVTWRSAWL